VEELSKTVSENPYQKALKYFTAKEMQEKYLALIQTLAQPVVQKQNQILGI